MKSALLVGAIAVFVATAYFTINIANNSSQFQLQFSKENIEKFQNYRAKYHQQYDEHSPQYNHRLRVFLENIELIKAHNSNKENTFTMGINAFTDLTQQEFHAIYLSSTQVSNSKDQNPGLLTNDQKNQSNSNKKKGLKIQEYINWVDLGGTSRVENMGECQASYVFAAVEAIEAAYIIDTSQDLLLSKEQVIQCSDGYGNKGCDGGSLQAVYQYIQKNKLTIENNYPYTSQNGVTGKCNSLAQGLGKYGMQKYQYLPADCNEIYDALLQRPISICMVPGFSLQYYQGGIYNQKQCPGIVNNFCLNLVGANIVGDPINHYWLLQNSWGTEWGEYGNMRLAYGNTCLMCTEAIQPQFG